MGHAKTYVYVTTRAGTAYFTLRNCIRLMHWPSVPADAMVVSYGGALSTWSAPPVINVVMSVSSGNDHCDQPSTQPGGPRTLPPGPTGALAPAQPANEACIGAERRLRGSDRTPRASLAWRTLGLEGAEQVHLEPQGRKGHGRELQAAAQVTAPE